MDFINKVLEFITGISKDVIARGRQIKAITRLKSQISACEEVIRKNYAEIGRLYYDKYMSGEDMPIFEKQCKAIDNAQRGVEELRKKLQEVKEQAALEQK